ncbi:MAG: DUF6089 family protein [Catalinimonas sp.]
MNRFTLTLLLLSLFAVDFDAFAQRRRTNTRRASQRISSFTSRGRFAAIKQYTTVGVSVGGNNYFGDIVPSTSVASTDLDFTRPSFGLWIARRVHPNIELRGNFMWARLRGDDYGSQDPDAGDNSEVGRYIRNLHFRNDVKELGFSVAFDLLGNNSTYIRRPPFTPYAHVGLAGFLHNPRARAPEALGGEWEALQPLNTEGPSNEYSLLQVAIPAGIGFRYSLTNNLDIALEIGYRFTFTDYLDDVASDYPDASTVANMDGLAQAMSFRSAEANAAVSGESRNLSSILSQRGLVVRSNDPNFRNGAGADYVATSLNATSGHGPGSVRGNDDGPDAYIVTMLKLRYIIAGQMRSPKFR